MNLTEKEVMEKAAIEYFIKAYHLDLQLIAHSDKPDFSLQDSKGKSIGVEITNLLYDKKEAKMLLGKSQEVTHGVMSASELIHTLNQLLNKKAIKLSGYKAHDKFFLVIRVPSPIFGKSTFDLFEDQIICPQSNFDEIWLVFDESHNEDSRLKLIYSKGIKSFSS